MPDHCYRCGEGEARICVSCAAELSHDEGRITPPDWWPEWSRESAHWQAALYVVARAIAEMLARDGEKTGAARRADVGEECWDARD